MAITWAHALAWRLERQLLEPVGDVTVVDVVRRLGAVPSMDEGLAELAVGVRRSGGRRGDLAAALAEGSVIKAFAFRGAMHYLSPDDGGAYLALRCAGRQWLLPSWREYYQLTAEDWPAFRATVREALADGPLTIPELGAAVTRHARFRHLRPVFDDGAGTLIKPLTWQGDMGFAPARDGQHAFWCLDDNPRWAGVWDLDEAGPHAIEAYLRSYGPATPEHVHSWLGNGLSAGRKRLQGWLRALEGRLAEVDIEGETALVLEDDLEALQAARPTDVVRLLPGHDAWVMGPGTKDAHVVPPAHRDPVTRKANLVIVGGVVRGTWALRGAEVTVTWFAGAGRPPTPALEAEVARLGAFLAKDLTATVTTG
jgi:hypothetical protein